MESLQRLINETKRYTLEIGHSFWVYFTHVNNPHSFYVRPLEYNQYMATVQARGDHVKKSEIKIGTIVIFKSELTKEYVRGKIIFIEGEGDVTCDLFALDIGFIENCVPIQNIWKPYFEVNLPALAFHCQLGNCQPRTEKWLDSTIDAMKGYVLGQAADIIIKNIMPEAILVEVCITYPDDLATLLAITRHTSFGYMDDLDYQLTIFCKVSNHFYSERILQVKSVLRIRMQSGSFLDKFFVAQVDEYNSYVEEREEYTAYAEKEIALDMDQLKLNTPVGVFYHRTNKFERGIVKQLFPNKNMAKVELVDWGKMIEASVEIMRPIPEQFLISPPLAIYCALHIDQYSTTKLSVISNLANVSYPGIEALIKIEEVGDNEDSPTLVTVSGIKK